MVEGILVNRGLERMKRSCRPLSHGIPIGLELWPWPHRCGVIFSFDCEGTYGGGKTLKGETEVVPELAGFLQGENIKGSFNFVGKVAEEFRDVVSHVSDLGHEIGGHGYSHIYLDGLDRNEQLKEIEKTIESIERACGQRIRGCRTPYLTYDENTYDLLDELGFLWDSSWSRSLWGKTPFNPVFGEKTHKIVEIPTDDIHYDAGLYRWDSPPQEVAHLWINHLKVTLMERSLYVFLNHPVNMAVSRDRISAVKKLVRHAKTLEDIWITTCGDLASRYNSMKAIDFSVQHMAVTKEGIEISAEISNRSEADVNEIQLLIRGIPMDWEVRGIESDKTLKSRPDKGRKDISIGISVKRESRERVELVIERGAGP